MKYDIFISYRRTDRELVAHIVRKLEERGAAVWYDAEIEGGADWREIIVEALSNSDMLVIFFSEACNQSRQLKKELAVADDMGKPVVPILIENTKPKGAYLYELADRNWLQAFPDPMSHSKDIVDHLIALARKSPGGLEGMTTDAPPPELSLEKASNSSVQAPAPGTSDSLFKSGPANPAEPRAEDYIGKKSRASKKAQHLNDVLPFRWIDIAILGPLLAAWIWFVETQAEFSSDFDGTASVIVAHGIWAVALIGLFGALVFPLRYYLRRRPPLHALTRYIVSSLILYLLLIVMFAVGDAIGLFPSEQDSLGTVALVFGGVWLAFMVVAFILYGVLATQRALRAFRSNITKV